MLLVEQCLTAYFRTTSNGQQHAHKRHQTGLAHATFKAVDVYVSSSVHALLHTLSSGASFPAEHTFSGPNEITG